MGEESEKSYVGADGDFGDGCHSQAGDKVAEARSVIPEGESGLR
jgi:hypothetical protein